MTGLLEVLIAVIATPVWVPILRKQSREMRQWIAALTCLASALLQIIFVSLVGHNVLTSAYSPAFAALGISCSAAALILTRHSPYPASSKISGGLGIVMWLVLLLLR